MMFRSLLLMPFLAFGGSSANAADDKEMRHLAARLYLNCLDREAARIISKTPNPKPSQFERLAVPRCKEDEDRLRQLLQIDIFLPQVQQKKFLNKEAQAALLEAVEQTITSIRRSMVIAYAEEFDKRNPGLRACSQTSTPQGDERLRYLCAVRD
ncbi:hypothetical protein [Bradyrhizobium sp. SZCCHNRI2049]|uniref:hypothetical protein n=1 Tax=Bradyrhizobium sp. SZCCHNRI2049 TaxID=3057287 RepID=UPI002916DD1B|nr:hypothetical protein [Bradyrhizobium sp. SZCCHNRI2049]